MFDVGEIQGDELDSAHGGGVAEQDGRGVADPDRGGGVDAVDDLPDLFDGEWSGESARCGAVRPTESAKHLADGFGGDGVGEAAGAVDVADDGAGHVEGAGGPAGFGTPGEVGRTARAGRRADGRDGAVGGLAPTAPAAQPRVSGRGPARRRIVYPLYDTHVAELPDEAIYHAEHLRLGAPDRPAVND